MAPASVASSLRLGLAGVGGSPPGNEEALIASVRSRLNHLPAGSSVDVMVEMFIYGIDPIVRYCLSGIGNLRMQAMGSAKRAELVYSLFESIAQRTRLVR